MKSKIVFLFVIFMVTIILPANLVAQAETFENMPGIKLIKPVSATINNFSGDELHLTVGQKAEQPIRAQVLWDDDSPAQNKAVVFFNYKNALRL